MRRLKIENTRFRRVLYHHHRGYVGQAYWFLNTMPLFTRPNLFLSIVMRGVHLTHYSVSRLIPHPSVTKILASWPPRTSYLFSNLDNFCLQCLYPQPFLTLFHIPLETPVYSRQVICNLPSLSNMQKIKA